MAGLERDVLVDRHTLVHDRHTGSMDIRRADEVRDVLIVPVDGGRLVLVALVMKSLIRAVLVILRIILVDTSLQRVLELGWRGWEAGLRGVAGRRIWGSVGASARGGETSLR